MLQRTIGLVGASLLLAATVACAPRPVTTDAVPTRDPAQLRVAAFDFPESLLLAEIYRAHLDAQGFTVGPVARLGPREVTGPALEQGRIDMVIEYAGSALNFVQRKDAAEADPALTHRRLRDALRTRGLVAANAARAQNQNVVAVRRTTADELDLRSVSDLRTAAGDLVMGGPPECRSRMTCLTGLEEVYGITFAKFLPINGTAKVAAALHAEEIDVGLVFSTDPAMARTEFLALDDDRGLQPAENITPVLRADAVERHGQELVTAIDAVSAELTTTELAHLNLQVADGAAPETVAAQWLKRHGLTR